ncbi:MAG TPA: AraC family ligand binding domain-containing protein, partial [Polyangiaceae bacterium]
MLTSSVIRRGPISVIDNRCHVVRGETPFVECHEAFSISYVRKGTFGYRTRGRSFELVTGSVLIGHPGDEYICTHDHGEGDECLSFFLAPEVVDSVGGGSAAFRVGALPPLADIMVLGELAQTTAEGSSDVELDEL